MIDRDPRGRSRGTLARRWASSAILERGRAVLHELPWFAPSRLPAPIISALLASLPGWHFRPAIRLGEARRVWAIVQYSYKP